MSGWCGLLDRLGFSPDSRARPPATGLGHHGAAAHLPAARCGPPPPRGGLPGAPRPGGRRPRGAPRAVRRSATSCRSRAPAPASSPCPHTGGDERRRAPRPTGRRRHRRRARRRHLAAVRLRQARGARLHGSTVLETVVGRCRRAGPWSSSARRASAVGRSPGPARTRPAVGRSPGSPRASMRVRTRLVAVVAGDMPYAGPALVTLVAALRTAPPEVGAVVATDADGVANPLLAAYRTASVRAALPIPAANRPAKLLLAVPHLEVGRQPGRPAATSTPRRPRRPRRPDLTPATALPPSAEVVAGATLPHSRQDGPVGVSRAWAHPVGRSATR